VLALSCWGYLWPISLALSLINNKTKGERRNEKDLLEINACISTTVEEGKKLFVHTRTALLLCLLP
jgi:hypothetical protein